MDAVKFLKEYRRMCKKYVYMEAGGEDCSSKCPFYGEHCDLACNDMNANDVVYKVEQWAQTHPQKAMIDDFFEKFPNAPKNEDGTPKSICPNYCGYTDEPDLLSICDKFDNDCLRCWSRPLEN